MNKLSKFNPVPMTEVDVDEDNNTYIAENGVRGERICGSRLKNKRTHVCGNKVTTAKKCQHHIVKYSQSYWEQLNEELALPENLKGLYEIADGVPKEELISVTNLLRRITVMYWSVLGNPQKEIIDKNKETIKIHTPAQLEYLRKMDGLYLNVMESERRIENRTLMKGQFITKVMESIFAVISKNTSPENAKIIVAQIGQVVFAYHEEGKITGEVEDLQAKIKGFEAIIDEEIDIE